MHCRNLTILFMPSIRLSLSCSLFDFFLYTCQWAGSWCVCVCLCVVWKAEIVSSISGGYLWGKTKSANSSYSKNCPRIRCESAHPFLPFAIGCSKSLQWKNKVHAIRQYRQINGRHIVRIHLVNWMDTENKIEANQSKPNGSEWMINKVMRLNDERLMKYSSNSQTSN